MYYLFIWKKNYHTGSKSYNLTNNFSPFKIHALYFRDKTGTRTLQTNAFYKPFMQRGLSQKTPLGIEDDLQ